MKMPDRKITAVIIAIFLPGLQAFSDGAGALIPQAAEAIPAAGSFTLSEDTIIVTADSCAELGGYLRELLAPATGYTLEINRKEDGGNPPGNSISLGLDSGIEGHGKEGYALSVTENGVAIRAPAVAGIYNGIQTLRQLLPPAIESSQPVPEGQWEIPCVAIKDRPRFEWRGLMIDCSRTFWSKEYLKRIIRLMSLYKMNRLHLHLTDDQGWRLEIKKYPRLTEYGARFPEKYKEPEERQGYYTQEDMRDIVAYAQRHNVVVVPEIEMPGHALAALACFPELSCTGGPFEIHPFFKGPTIHKDIFCAGNEQTLVFIEDVLAEVVEIFPSDFIHVGGDEAPKDRWKECPKCQARLKSEDLADEHELQSWLIKRVGAFLGLRGKRMIGWQEIMDGGLAPGAAVMSWRGTYGGMTAARMGRDAVMSPKTYCYFDYTYKRISTMKAYSFDPVPGQLDEGQSRHILGAQANFWSHMARTEAKADKQLFPRLLSIAEIGWVDAGRDPDGFRRRVNRHIERLKLLDVECYDDPSLAEQKFLVLEKDEIQDR